VRLVIQEGIHQYIRQRVWHGVWHDGWVRRWTSREPKPPVYRILYAEFVILRLLLGYELLGRIASASLHFEINLIRGYLTGVLQIDAIAELKVNCE
jgi:hypothetical protein